MKSSVRSYLLNLLLYVYVVNEIGIPSVSCQDEENYQCLPRRTFFALLRLPKVTSNVAAWSRKYRNDIDSLKGFITEDNSSPEVCLPADVYLDLFGGFGFLGHLRALDRAQRMYKDPATQSYVPIDKLDASRDRDSEEGGGEEDDDEDEGGLYSEKRSIATLAKNGDLPISLHLDKPEEEEDEEEKRGLATLVHDATAGSSLNREELEALLRLSEFDKRNVAALARDFALPQSNSGKRNIAALARDFALPSPSGKRNVAALARDFALPSGKRNIAALARDYALPYGKRYLDIFSRTSAPRFQSYGDGKRNIASLVRNGDLPVGYKRNVASLARDWTLPKQYRFGRSLQGPFEIEEKLTNFGLQNGNENRSKIRKDNAGIDEGNEKKLEALTAGNPASSGYHKLGDKERKIEGKSPIGITDGPAKRPKRQIEFSDEYPLPVMQNNNVLDYEEMIEALTGAGEYPNAEKRFMAAGEPMEIQEMEEKEDPIFSAPAAKRHIGALARLGWLPSFRASRFSRSPRYLVNRENSADGTSADYPADSSSRSLGLLGRTNRYSRSQNFGDCRHGFKRFLVLPSSPLDKIFLNKLYTTPKTA